MTRIANALFSRMLFHLRESSFAREPTSSSSVISDLIFKDLLQHLGSEVDAQDPSDNWVEHEMDNNIEVDGLGGGEC